MLPGGPPQDRPPITIGTAARGGDDERLVQLEVVAGERDRLAGREPPQDLEGLVHPPARVRVSTPHT